MIIFFQSGQLGNQIFQYLAMKKFDDKEKIIFVLEMELSNVFKFTK